MALAAIQGLYQLLEDQQRQLTILESRLVTIELERPIRSLAIAEESGVGI